MKRMLVLLLIATLFIAASGCITNQPTTNEVVEKKRVSVNESQELVTDDGKKFGELNTNITADVEGTADCGSPECFEDKFSECKPAKLTAKLTNTIIYYYEIIGPKNGGCEVKSKYTANPNPAWVGKEMTCVYDNTMPFETALKNTAEKQFDKCEGPLYKLMTGK